MSKAKVYAMSFAKVYPMLIAKAEKKGRSQDEVLEVTSWLTGYRADQILSLIHISEPTRRTERSRMPSSA